MAFASKEIIELFNKVKYPYNVNALTQQQALEALKRPIDVEEWVKVLLQERTRMMQAFTELPICEKVYPTEANFFLAKMSDATRIYNYLVDQGIIVRNRTRVQLCQNCLRITIGTKSENSEPRARTANSSPPSANISKHLIHDHLICWQPIHFA